MVLGDREHPPGAAREVVYGPHQPGPRERLLVLDEEPRSQNKAVMTLRSSRTEGAASRASASGPGSTPPAPGADVSVEIDSHYDLLPAKRDACLTADPIIITQHDSWDKAPLTLASWLMRQPFG